MQITIVITLAQRTLCVDLMFAEEAIIGSCMSFLSFSGQFVRTEKIVIDGILTKFYTLNVLSLNIKIIVIIVYVREV